MDENGVMIGDGRIAAKTVFWAAGVASSPAAQWLDVEADRAGRIVDNDDLTVGASQNIFAIGDTVNVKGWHGEPVPGLAPAAKQAGLHAARTITREIRGQERPGAFKYDHLGSMATIGRKAAVADFGFIRLHGVVAWWLWGAIHVAFLANMRSRISVSMDWFWAYLTF